MRAAKVIQKPGPVFVLAPTFKLSISCLTSARRAMSIAKATVVISAARNDMSDARSVTVRWVDRPRRSAMNDAPAATGVTTRPRVQEERIWMVSWLTGEVVEKE